MVDAFKVDSACYPLGDVKQVPAPGFFSSTCHLELSLFELGFGPWDQKSCNCCNFRKGENNSSCLVGLDEDRGGRRMEGRHRPHQAWPPPPAL